ncbi:alpha/beta fold hydrolase [Actinosynnema sp. NPDC053489]|uniref:alpha/beta fold hydrolase n=1 Tax=Actinosynnema sp. NPDC053489 TaxID=3363916 RepID=UPI0037CB49C7
MPYRVRRDGGVRSLEAGVDRAGSPVVVVPGLGVLGHLVDTLVASGDRARSFLLDVPGFGHRPPRPCAPEVGAVADAVEGWLDLVLGDERVVLAGHSTGAQAALRVAARRPDRVGALVLMGPTFPPEQRRLPGLVRGCLADLCHEPPVLLPVAAPYYARGGVRGLSRFVRSAQRDEPEQVIRDVRCPTLLVRGERDAFAPRSWLDRLAAAAPDARQVVVPGAHVFQFRRGRLTADLIGEAARRAGLVPGEATHPDRPA